MSADLKKISDVFQSAATLAALSLQWFELLRPITEFGFMRD